ncbi:MAG: hypothetical protein ACRDXC_12485 [Acidimicrobiales bacterium]
MSYTGTEVTPARCPATADVAKAPVAPIGAPHPGGGGGVGDAALVFGTVVGGTVIGGTVAGPAEAVGFPARRGPVR